MLTEVANSGFPTTIDSVLTGHVAQLASESIPYLYLRANFFIFEHVSCMYMLNIY